MLPTHQARRRAFLAASPFLHFWLLTDAVKHAITHYLQRYDSNHAGATLQKRNCRRGETRRYTAWQQWQSVV